MEAEQGDTPIVRELQAALFPVYPKGTFLSELLTTSLKTTQLEVSTDWRTQRSVARLREPRDLYALKKEPCGQQAARWPVECQVLADPVDHSAACPSAPEHYYVPTGRELQPKPVGEEAGTVIYDYNPTSAVTYFSRSAVGGLRVEPEPGRVSKDDHTLQFESRFESGNLAKVVKVTDTYYELYLRTDLYTNRHMQWFYFQLRNMRANTMYRLSIVNLSKPESLYSCGMKPLLYSNKKAQLKRVGWHRIGDNISYFRNDLQIEEEEGSAPCYTLTFTLEFPYADDTVYLAHCYPYTYSTLQDYLLSLQNHPVKSEYTKLRLLCRSLAGNNVYYLTVTEPTSDDNRKKKPAVVVTARVHPGETPASYMMKGLIDFITGSSEPARELRHKFIFKLIPMLNPDGVIVGNNRCSLTGRDLNRQYRTVIRETYPPVWHTKVLLRRLSEDCGIALYCDLHAHSRRHNIFIYGCESRRACEQPLQEQVFPLMMRKNAPDKFCFESCKFRIQRSKEGTGRVVVWMMGVPTSYTLEASFGGSTLGSRADTHFSTSDYEGMGRTFCETLLDFCDDEPSKERLRAKIIERLLKEGSSADEPTNINLSDYSSDEGDTSSCSDDDEEGGATLHANWRVKVEEDEGDTALRETWSVSANEEVCVSSRSPPRTEKPPRKVDRDDASPPRQSLPMSTLELPESESLVVSDEAASVAASHRRHRSNREYSRRGPSPAREGRVRVRNMPPELIVTQAQVYEACLEVTQKVAITEAHPVESSSLPCIARRATRPHTGEGERQQRSTAWHQLRSIPVYRAYYESHRVLVQRQTVEERLVASSPVQGQMWGLQPPPAPRSKPKLQRQKSRTQQRPREAVGKEQEAAPCPAAGNNKSKLRSKFKKSSLVTLAVSQGKPESSGVKSGSKPTSSSKPASPTKRRNKKLTTRVQSTDF